MCTYNPRRSNKRNEFGGLGEAKRGLDRACYSLWALGFGLWALGFRLSDFGSRRWGSGPAGRESSIEAKGSGLQAARESLLNLLQMVEVVAGDQTDDVFHTFLATLGVNPEMLPLIFGERLV
jgi:hypothetical protein